MPTTAKNWITRQVEGRGPKRIIHAAGGRNFAASTGNVRTMSGLAVSIVIPTLNRGAVLVDTVQAMLEQDGAAEIVIVDQTPSHPEDVALRLAGWADRQQIRWIKLSPPSIPRAMNRGLQMASGQIVLFLDDDIVPGDDLIAKHAANYTDTDTVAVAGQVIQPWQAATDVPRPKPKPGIWEDLDFPFHSTRRAIVRNVMAGNLSVRRDAALAAGGFDENFIGAAHRFETEFCRRLVKDTGKIVFDPDASVRHLKLPQGGIRTFGKKFEGMNAAHYTSDFYFGLKCGALLEAAHYIAFRLYQVTMQKSLLKRPWHLPGHLWCQAYSLCAAVKLYRSRKRRSS